MSSSNIIHSSGPGNFQNTAAETISQFESAMREAGLLPPSGGIKADGQIHRCDAEDKNGKGDGSHCLHLDGIPAGWFQNHRDGAGVRRWHVRTRQKLSAADIAAHKDKVCAMQAQREADLAKRQDETAKRAAAIVGSSAEAPASHAYLTKKNIQSYGVRHSAAPVAISAHRDSGPDVLIVPMQDIEGDVQTAQLIDASGEKSFLAGGRKRGCFYVIRKTAAESPDTAQGRCVRTAGAPAS